MAPAIGIGIWWIVLTMTIMITKPKQKLEHKETPVKTKVTEQSKI